MLSFAAAFITNVISELLVATMCIFQKTIDVLLDSQISFLFLHLSNVSTIFGLVSLHSIYVAKGAHFIVV